MALCRVGPRTHHPRYRWVDGPTLQVRGDEPRQAVPEPDGQAAGPDLGEGQGGGGLLLGEEDVLDLPGELGAVALDVQLEVEPEAPRVEVGRADEGPGAVDDHQLGVVER